MKCSCCGRFSLARFALNRISNLTTDEIIQKVRALSPSAASSTLFGPGFYLFKNGSIRTMVPALPTVEAILIGNDTIQALGALVEVEAVAPTGTTMVDLDGRCLIPGFIEPHMHIVGGALNDLMVDLSPPATELELYTMQWVTQALQAALDAADPVLGWVMASGFDASKLDVWTNLTVTYFSALDNPHGIPILVQSGSGHISYVNDIVLNLAGITIDTPQPSGGIIGKFEDSGQLSGIFVEMPAQALLLNAFDKRIPPIFDLTKLGSAVAKLINEAISNGLTLLNDAALGISMGFVKEKAVLEGVWDFMGQPVRLASALYLDEWNEADIPDTFANGPDFTNPMFFLQAVKLFADGSNQGVTGFQRAPYTQWALQRTQEDYLGTNILGNSDSTVDNLSSLITRAVNHNWQVMIHANGDAAIDNVLDAYALAQAGGGQPGDLRHRVEHCSLLHDDQIARMVELALSPSFLIEHVANWGEQLQHILGDERIMLLDRCASVLKAGMRFSLHSDYPVSTFNPLQLVQDAVTRVVRSTNTQLNPAECVSVDQALRAKTIDAAWQCHMDQYVGSLEVGKFADLVVLEYDPYENGFVGNSVWQTWVRGRQVYESGS